MLRLCYALRNVWFSYTNLQREDFFFDLKIRCILFCERNSLYDATICDTNSLVCL